LWGHFTLALPLKYLNPLKVVFPMLKLNCFVLYFSELYMLPLNILKSERTNKLLSNLILFLPVVLLQAVGDVVLQLHAGLPLTGIELVN